ESARGHAIAAPHALVDSNPVIETSEFAPQASDPLPLVTDDADPMPLAFAPDAEPMGDPASNPTTHLNTQQAGAQITRDNYHWGTTLGQPAGPITFGFATSGPGYSVGGHDVSQFSAFTASEQTAARAALQMWSDVSGITFSDQGNTNNATILFRNYNDPNDASEAFAFYPTSNNQTAGSNQGDMFMNLAFASTTVNP